LNLIYPSTHTHLDKTDSVRGSLELDPPVHTHLDKTDSVRGSLELDPPVHTDSP